jgi:hypothetical protein
MKTQKLLLILGIALFLITGTINAQDKIYLKNSKDILDVNLIEIGTTNVRYTSYGDTTSLIFNIEKRLIDKIVTEEGDQYAFADPLLDPAMYIGQKKNALKFGFFNPFFGSLQFSYERSLEPGKSIETTLGIIGLGVDVTGTEPAGGTIKFGYKMIKTPDYIIPGMRAKHILNGGYIKPEIIFNYFQYNAYSYDYYSYGTTRGNSISGAIVLNFGKQWIINNFLVDFYLGTGFGFASNDDYYDGLYYGFAGAWDGFPIAFTGGLKIGFLFK